MERKAQERAELSGRAPSDVDDGPIVRWRVTGVGEDGTPQAAEELQARAADERTAREAAERLAPGSDLTIQRMPATLGRLEQVTAHVTVPADTAALAESLAMSVFGEALPWVRFERLAATQVEPG